MNISSDTTSISSIVDRLEKMHQMIYSMAEQAQQANQEVHQQQIQIDNILQTNQHMSEQTDQKFNNIFERVQQTQQQMEDVLQKIHQPLQRQADDILQQGQQMLQHMHETDQEPRQKMPPYQQTCDEIRKYLKGITNFSIGSTLLIVLGLISLIAAICWMQLAGTSLLQRQEFERLIIKSHTQVFLARSFKELPIPRLFIVLPIASGHVDLDNKSSPL
ncbi:hypothetical protein BGZ65_007913, partial [Modicella reniformis]